jgi:hypothetical protein
MAGVSICVVHKKVAQLCSGQLDEWVLASVGSIYSIGGSYTYLGCSKHVYGASSSQSWLCRKNVGKDDTFPEECLNHGYKHEKKCCSPEEGIICYRFSIRLVDQSSELEALIWASALHLLSVPPEEFQLMSTNQQDEVFQGLQGRDWKFNVLSVVDQLGYRQFKVQFILPTEKSYVLRSYRPSVEMTDLSRMACLTLPTYPRSTVDPQGRHGFSNESTTLAHKWMTEEITAPPILEREMPPQWKELPSIEEKEAPSQDLSFLRTCLESLVSASQQNTKAIEQLALTLKEGNKSVSPS